MFNVNYKNLRLSFNDFHEFTDKDMPQYGEYCLLELKTGDYTAGGWYPSGNGRSAGYFLRGTADTVDSGEVARWHSLDRYDLTESLEKEGVNWINIGREEEEGERNVQFEGFKSFTDRKKPKEKQICLLIMIWRTRGCRIRRQRENEKKREKRLNRNPSADPELFKYGTNIDAYYEKALAKLREEFCWATVTMMKKRTPVWQIAPLHGKYVFGKISKNYCDNSDIVTPWTEGTTADEFIDFLCSYTHDTVEHSNPEKKFSLGTDINVYLETAFKNVQKDYRWLDKKMLAKTWQYDIQRVDGDLEFVRRYWDESEYSVYDVESAEQFIEWVEHDYQSLALRENETVASYAPHFGHIELHGWNLESYVFYKLKSGDYKVSVTAGDRTTGGSRDFFITPDCFEAKTYEEFLERYLEIVPGYSFGLGKKDLLPDKDLKKFLGY